MTLSIWIICAAIVALVALSAIFSGSETALTAASRARMHSLEGSGDGGAATGALAASRRELDIIGFGFFAVVTGLGGGATATLSAVPGTARSCARHAGMASSAKQP